MSAGELDAMGPKTRDFLAELFGSGTVYDQLKACAYREAGDRAHKVDPSLAALESLVQAALRRNQFRGASKQEFWAWLRTILVNQVRDGLRRAECRNVSLDEPGGEGSKIAAEDDSTAQKMADEHAALGIALERLSDSDRELFCLYHRSDIPRSLVAQMLDIPPDTLRQRAKRVRQKLKSLLEDRPE